MQIGEIEIRPVLDGCLVFPEPPGFPDRESPDFAPHRAYLSDDRRWRMELGAFLVRPHPQSDRLILIDAGGGPGDGALIRPRVSADGGDIDPAILAYYRERELGPGALQDALRWLAQTEISRGRLLRSLAELGVAPGDITDVVLSHLHFDHVGWVSAEGVPVFPNAVYRAERRDLDHFLRPERAAEDGFYRAAWGAVPNSELLGAVRDRFEPWDGDHAIAPGLDAIFAPGHTPGHSIFLLSSGNDRAMILGDAVHCPLELTDADFSIMSDMDPALADRTRERIRQEIENRDIPAAAAHFPGLSFGRLLAGNGRRSWNFQAWN